MDYQHRDLDVPRFRAVSAIGALTIVGSERYTDYAEFRRIVTPYLDTGQLDVLMSHGTTGTFKMTQQLANDINIKFESLSGDSSQPFEIDESVRIQIRQRCQQILVFVDPKSVQVWNIVNYARSVGKTCVIFNIQIEPGAPTPNPETLRLPGSRVFEPQSPYPYSIPGIPMALKRVVPTLQTTLTSIDLETQKIPVETSTVQASVVNIVLQEKSRIGVDVPAEPACRTEREDHTSDLQVSTSQIEAPKSPIDSKSESTAPISALVTPTSIKLRIRPKSQPRLVIRAKLPSQIITQDWTVSRICEAAVPPGWESVFTDAALELKQISELLETDEQRSMIVPLKKNLFRALEILPMSKVRVIIWGQDPYHQLLSHGEPRAVGLSFSVSRQDEVPRSLVNIYREISDNISEFVIPKHGDLTSWSQQGVLLLNSSLTCRVNDPNSHAKYGIWLPFIVRLIRGIEQVRPNCIHLLWGKEALKIKQHISERSIVLTASHPSPLSAERGFFGCRHFINVNEILKGFGEAPINWNLDPAFQN